MIVRPIESAVFLPRIAEPPWATNAIEVRDASRLIVIAGMIALDRDGTIVGKGDITAQARMALENMREILRAVGADMNAVVKLTTWLTKREYLQAVVDVKREFFERPPVSSTVVSDLAHEDLLVEIEALAVTE